MKKNTFLIFLFCIALFSCQTESKIEKDLSKTDFIYLEGKKFKHKKNDFFAVMLNYFTRIREINGKYLITGTSDYETPKKYEGTTIDSALIVLKGRLQLIKELGFNTIRIVGSLGINKENEIIVYTPKYKTIPLENNYEVMFSAIEQFIEIAKEVDLRVMMLFHAPIEENPEKEKFTKALLKRFSNEPTIFAYDFFNEPLYFDRKEYPNSKRSRKKEDAYEIVKKWKQMVEENAPNQLLTIGYSEPIEVFEWDQELLPVDFVQFHTYHPLRVPNEIYWYSKYINKPWIIGETSLPADNDSISYAEQAQFMREAYKRTVNCGGTGFGWWQFQDVNWGNNYEHNYTSLLNLNGTTTTKDGKYTIKGSVKPAAYELNKLKNYTPTYECPCMVNYYNMVGYENIIISGKIINKDTQKPIEGAVIRGWNKSWKIGANTYTDQEGIFKLYSNTEFVHFEISAPGMTKIKFNYNAKYKALTNDTLMINLPNQELEYQQITYQQFLKNDSTDMDFIIFNFDERKFNKAKFEGNMGIRELKPLF